MPIPVPKVVESLVENKEVDAGLKRRLLAALSLVRRHNARHERSRTPPPTRAVTLPSAKNSVGVTLTWRDPSARQVSVRGTFTNPPWAVELVCSRDVASKVFKADLSDQHIGPGTYLYKFIVDGKWRADPRQPTQLDRDGVLNNVIFFNQSVRPLRPVNSAPSLAELLHPAPPPPPAAAAAAAASGSVDQRLTRHRTLHNVLHGSCHSSAVHRSCTDLSAAAAASGELEAKRTSGLQLRAGAWMIPHPEKMRSADAMFFCPSGLGVSDSVGEWEWRFRLDPQAFAEQLMAGCLEQARAEATAQVELEGYTVDKRARAALEKAFRETSAYGSATACVGFLSENGDALGIANLGDSSALHFRKEHVVGGGVSGASCLLKTKEQQHTFNMPFQLTRLPAVGEFEKVLARDPSLKYFIETLRTLAPAGVNQPAFSETDQPEAADTYFCPVEEGDLVIFASDGLLDNLWLVQVTAIVSTCVSPYEARVSGGALQATPPQEIARRIAQEAYDVSVRRSGLSSQTPFGYNSRRHNHRFAHAGGKPDDITVVAAWLTRPPEHPDHRDHQQQPQQEEEDDVTTMTSAQWHEVNHAASDRSLQVVCLGCVILESQGI